MTRMLSFALALAALGAGVILTMGVFSLGRHIGLPPIPPVLAALITGLFAMLIAWRVLPKWWRPVLLIMPFATVLSFSISPWWFFAASILLIALQWNAVFTRIPLYRSDKIVAQSLTHFMQFRGYRSLLDIGCGDGRLLMRMARDRPEANFVGIESAPVLYLIAYWRCRNQPNCQILFGDFWKLSWAPYDVVFSFLSPEPMLWVWRKAGREMGAQGVLLSLAFAVPGIEENGLLPAQHFDIYLYEQGASRPSDSEDKKNDS